MAKKPIPPKALTPKAPSTAKKAQAAASKKTVAKSAPKPVTRKTAAAKPASKQVAKKASVKSVRKETAPKPVARKCASKMAAPVSGKKAVATKPVAKSAGAAKVAAKPAVKTAKPAAVKATKPVVKTAAKSSVKSVAKPATKSVVKPVAKSAAAKVKGAKVVPAKVEAKKAVKKSAPVAVTVVAKKATAKPAGASKAVVSKKAVATPVANNKTVKVAPVAARKASDLNAARELRRAFGSYDGIVLCEQPGYFPEKTPYTEKELAAIQKLLQDRRRHLLEVLRELDDKTFSNTLDSGKAYHATANTHLFEGASDNMASDMALMVRQEEEQALTQVEAALERLEEGLFGVCVACGDKIGIPRLKAKPEAHLCISCKTVYDKKSRLR